MVELLPDAFCLVKDLIERKHQPRPEAISVIDGNTPGWVFVDSVGNPSTALVWAKGLEGFHFCGDPHSDAFRHDIDGFVGGCLAKRLMEKGLDCFEVSGDPGWETIIPHLFPSREMRRDKQCVYLSGKGDWRVPPVNPVPEGFFLVTIQDVLRHPENPFLSPLGSSEGSDSTVQIPTGFENHELACGMIERNWGQNQTSQKKRLASASPPRRESSALRVPPVKRGTHAIEIETDEAYRRRGLAEIVAQALLNAHANHGVLSHWDCMEDNHASARLAEKLGLVKAYAYDLFWFPIDG